MLSKNTYEIEINKKRIHNFIKMKIIYLFVLLLPVFLIFKIDYQFDNHVINALLVMMMSYLFKRMFLLTVVFFLLDSDESADMSKTDNRVLDYQASFQAKYPKTTIYNNIIMISSNIIFIVGIVYFVMSTTSLMYQ